MELNLIRTVLFAVLAALLLDPVQSQRLVVPLGNGLTWAQQQWPQAGLGALSPALDWLPTGLAILLLLLIPITWLRPR
jgi:hypothetical protein